MPVFDPQEFACPVSVKACRPRLDRPTMNMKDTIEHCPSCTYTTTTYIRHICSDKKYNLPSSACLHCRSACAEKSSEKFGSTFVQTTRFITRFKTGRTIKAEDSPWLMSGECASYRRKRPKYVSRSPSCISKCRSLSSSDVVGCVCCSETTCVMSGSCSCMCRAYVHSAGSDMQNPLGSRLSSHDDTKAFPSTCMSHLCKKQTSASSRSAPRSHCLSQSDACYVKNICKRRTWQYGVLLYYTTLPLFLTRVFKCTLIGLCSMIPCSPSSCLWLTPWGSATHYGMYPAPFRKAE